jgi:hypothetical protein
MSLVLIWLSQRQSSLPVFTPQVCYALSPFQRTTTCTHIAADFSEKVIFILFTNRVVPVVLIIIPKGFGGGRGDLVSFHDIERFTYVDNGIFIARFLRQSG